MVRCFAPHAGLHRSGWPGVIDTPGITAAAAAPGVAITRIPGGDAPPPRPRSLCMLAIMPTANCEYLAASLVGKHEHVALKCTTTRDATS